MMKNAPKQNNRISLVPQLQKMGLSFSGSKEVLEGRIVSDPKDRIALAALVETATREGVPRYHLENAWPTK